MLRLEEIKVSKKKAQRTIAYLQKLEKEVTRKTKELEKLQGSCPHNFNTIVRQGIVSPEMLLWECVVRCENCQKEERAGHVRNGFIRLYSKDTPTEQTGDIKSPDEELFDSVMKFISDTDSQAYGHISEPVRKKQRLLTGPVCLKCVHTMERLGTEAEHAKSKRAEERSEGKAKESKPFEPKTFFTWTCRSCGGHRTSFVMGD